MDEGDTDSDHPELCVDPCDVQNLYESVEFDRFQIDGKSCHVVQLDLKEEVEELLVKEGVI